MRSLSSTTLNLRYESLLRNRCANVYVILPPDRVIESCFESA